MTSPVIEIGTTLIGPDHFPYLVAEISASHAGSIDHAHELIKAVSKTCADAIKFQAYIPDHMAFKGAYTLTSGTWKDRDLYSLYEEGQTPVEWLPELITHAQELSLDPIVSVFHPSTIAHLEKHSPPAAYKIASLELQDFPLLKAAAQTNRPIILSTGAHTLKEIQEAVIYTISEHVLSIMKTPQLVILHCICGYPSAAHTSNLKRISLLQEVFPEYPIGYSDHTIGAEAAIIATTLGACLIEKHFSLGKGLDKDFSANPTTLKLITDGTYAASETRRRPAQPDYTEAEIPYRELRRSLYALKDMYTGTKLTPVNIQSRRPHAGGISPKHFDHINGMILACHIKKGHPLTWSHLK